MNKELSKGYLAVGENGTSYCFGSMSRTDARHAAKTNTRFEGTKVIGLVDLDELASNFGHLVRRMNVKDRRQLDALLRMVATMPEEITQELFIEMAKRTLAPSIEADYLPFKIDRSVLEEVQEFKNAKWHDVASSDRGEVIALFEGALRAHAITEPTIGGHEVTLGLMAIAPHDGFPATDVFFRIYSPAFEHLVGDVLPLEDCEFFEKAAELAGTEEGPAYGIAVLELVLDRFAYVYRELDPYLTDEEKQAIEPPLPVGQGG